jgi:hypothetical protein
MVDDVGLIVGGLYQDGQWDVSRVHNLLAGCQPEYPWIRGDLDPPADPDVVVRVEKLHGVRLPHAYRSFILDVGAGGAGPNYGLFTFDRSSVARELPGSAWSGFLQASAVYRTPFAHGVAWNPKELLEGENPSDAYYSETETTGTWLLSDYGCAIWDFMVINGAARGEIWRDRRTEGRGLCPLAPGSDREDSQGSGRHTFDTWYSEWLRALVEDQLRRIEIRMNGSALQVKGWFARLIHNEIRRRDTEHRFLFAASVLRLRFVDKIVRGTRGSPARSWSR